MALCPTPQSSRATFTRACARAQIAAPCYLASERHLILPAYSAEAAGLNVLRSVGWDGYRCYAVVGDSVLDFGELTACDAKRQSSRT